MRLTCSKRGVTTSVLWYGRMFEISSSEADMLLVLPTCRQVLASVRGAKYRENRGSMKKWSRRLKGCPFSCSRKSISARLAPVGFSRISLHRFALVSISVLRKVFRLPAAFSTGSPRGRPGSRPSDSVVRRIAVCKFCPKIGEIRQKQLKKRRFFVIITCVCEVLFLDSIKECQQNIPNIRIRRPGRFPGAKRSVDFLLVLGRIRTGPSARHGTQTTKGD